MTESNWNFVSKDTPRVGYIYHMDIPYGIGPILALYKSPALERWVFEVLAAHTERHIRLTITLRGNYLLLTMKPKLIEVPVTDLPLYINYPYVYPGMERLLKGHKS